jgi:hypothetical protein
MRSRWNSNADFVSADIAADASELAMEDSASAKRPPSIKPITVCSPEPASRVAASAAISGVEQANTATSNKRAQASLAPERMTFALTGLPTISTRDASHGIKRKMTV